MKILMFGRTGQVATEVLRRAKGHEVTALGRDEADLSDPDACAAAIAEAKPALVLNAAAWTAVDAAEQNEEAARVINAEAPGAMAKACAKREIPLIHISTDYVFDGSGEQAWRESDDTGPINAYGRTKLAGEEAVRDAVCRHVILRTSWVFSAHGANFVKTMLRVGAEREELTVVDDQVGGPTPAAAIADACLAVASAYEEGTGVSGVFHFAGAPATTWRGFAQEIFEQAGMAVKVRPIATSEYPTPAARPLNSRLDCAAFEGTYGVVAPDWRVSLHDVLKELRESP